ncbi:MAG: methyltransferase domain-containing protein [Caldilineaceae bacterium]
MKERDGVQRSEQWNQYYGKAHLENFQHHRSKFLVDPTELSMRKAALLRAMPRINNAIVLEVGSGKGEFAVALAKLGAQVTGIDIGDDLIALSQMVAKLNNVYCHFRVGCLP